MDSNQTDRMLRIGRELGLLSEPSGPISEVEQDFSEEVPPESSAARKLLAFSKAHFAILVVILGVGITFAVMQLSRVKTEAVPVETVAAAPSTVESESVSPAAPQIRVHVIGAVVSPGVVSLPTGSRVEDAIAACGGLASGADPGQLNLAAVLSDGAQLVIGTTEAPLGQVNGAQEMGTGGLVNLNTASATQLEELPGVGPVMAEKIIAWRSEHGRFSAVSELQEVSGIGEKTYAQIAPHVCI